MKKPTTKTRHTLQAFTLIELLIVLAIVGATSAMVAPNLWKSFQRTTERQQVMDYAHQLMALRRQLHLSGNSLQLSNNQLTQKQTIPDLPSVPDGWLISANTPLFFLPTGVTNGGRIIFNSPTGRRWELLLQPLDGQISISGQKS